jgi:hypothetical protein
MARGLSWYARGLGAVHTGDLEAAREAEQRLASWPKPPGRLQMHALPPTSKATGSSLPVGLPMPRVMTIGLSS